MSGRPRQQELLPDSAAVDGTVAINARCALRTLDGHCVVSVAGVVVAQFAVGDRMAEAHARVSLVDQGWAEQREVARAFGCSTRTVRRDQRRFEEGGLAALGRQDGYPRGRPRAPERRSQQVFRLKASGHSNREIARRIGVSEKAVRKQARSLGFRPRSAEQEELALGDQGADPKVSATGAGPADPPAASTAVGADPNLSAAVEISDAR